MRPSRIVLAFGPGSIVDLPDQQTVIVMGTDFWWDTEEITEPRLARLLGVDYFGSPRESWSPRERRFLGVPVSSFPQLRYCPNCFLLTPRETCPKAACRKKSNATRPPRVVAACELGHMEDFPWKIWSGCTCPGGREELHLESNPSEALDGSDLLVRCVVCGRQRNLQGGLSQLHSGKKVIPCSGQRPWLGVDEDCEKPLRGVMRGASNVFFPIISSSLSIPPFSRRLHRLLAEGHHIEAARENWEAGRIDAYISASVTLNRWINQGICTAPDLRRAFAEVYDQPADIAIKAEEWETLTHDTLSEPGDDFRATRLNLESSPLEKWFARVVRVEALREVVALRGFTRLFVADDWDDPRIQKLRLPEEDLDELSQRNPNAPIPPRANRNWLPGFELHGEGLFFQFSDSAVRDWEARENVRRRLGPIISRPSTPRPRDCINTTIPRVVLVHSFAHHLIREISLSCGYTAASLRERLYVGNGDRGFMAGVLVYTSTPDSEGSLGGLVAQAKSPSRIWEHVDTLLDSVETCIRGPLCTLADPGRTGALEGASCYACSHLPETSCEGLGNTLLDRRSIRDLKGEFGFFDPADDY